MIVTVAARHIKLRK